MRSHRSKPKPSSSLRFEAIGTAWQLDTAEPMPEHVAAAIHSRIESYDLTWSRFRPDSLVSRVATTRGIHRFPDDAAPLFALYRKLYDATGGKVSPLVGGALETLGYDSGYSLRATGDVAVVPRWEDSIAWDGRALSTVHPVTIDVGAAGKGYLADLVAEILAASGIPDYTVDASGDIVHSGAPIRVALEHPLDTSKAIGVVDLGAGALCASAANRRAWGDGMHHILDATTGHPTAGVLATWTIAETGLVADGLATALFVADAKALAKSFEFEYVLMFSDGRVESSPGLDGEVFR